MGKICERTIGYEKKDPSGHYIRVGMEGAFSHFLKVKVDKDWNKK